MPVADLSDPALWQDDSAVQQAFANLRADAPVSWQYEDATRTGGYWAVVRHGDVLTVSRDAGRFSSASGTSIRSLPDEVNELIGSMLNTDDPRHAYLRRIVSAAFRSRSVRALDRRINDLAETAIGALLAEGGGDLVTQVAAPLPLQVICDLVGIPADHHEEVARHSETLGVTRDHREMLAAAQRLHEVAVRLAETRRNTPGDDLISAMVHTNVDGQSLDPTEIGSFFLLLVSAGSQTTRHAIAGGVVALHDHPDQLDRWRLDPQAATASAIEEIVRWVTPVRHFRRTATCDTELAGTPISEGDKVVIWYTSANRDDTAFPRPFAFDLSRDPNPHLGFGTGPHVCLGALLARRELAAVFTTLLTRPTAFKVIDCEPIASRFLAGYHRVHGEF